MTLLNVRACTTDNHDAVEAVLGKQLRSLVTVIDVHLLRFPWLHLVQSRGGEQSVAGRWLCLAAPLAAHQTASSACLDALQKVLFGDAKYSLEQLQKCMTNQCRATHCSQLGGECHCGCHVAIDLRRQAALLCALAVTWTTAEFGIIRSCTVDKLPYLTHAWLVCHGQKRLAAIPAGLLHGHLALNHCQEGLRAGRWVVHVCTDLA